MIRKSPARALRASYTLPELATMLGMSYWAVRRLLARRHIPVDKESVPHRVWLSTLKRHAPEAWESVLTIASLARSA